MPPDRAAWTASALAAGWTPSEALHDDVLEFVLFRRRLGDRFVHGPSGPVLAWPAAWGRRSLARHLATCESHLDELRLIAMKEMSP